MKRYRAKIFGESFLLDLDGELETFGFSTSRIVKASNPDDAKRIALIRIHQELNQAVHIVKNSLNAARVHVESIEELKFFQFLSKKDCKGLEFIREDICE